MGDSRFEGLSREGARLQVQLDLQRVSGRRRGWEELVILDRLTIERPWGWVFFYTTRGWLHGDDRYAIGGNAPYMVNRDGSMRFAGTARPIEHYIEAYEADLERQSGTWELFIDEPADCPLATASAIRSSLGLPPSDAWKLKRRLPSAVMTGARVDLEPTRARLFAAGVRAEIRYAR